MSPATGDTDVELGRLRDKRNGHSPAGKNGRYRLKRKSNATEGQRTNHWGPRTARSRTWEGPRGAEHRAVAEEDAIRLHRVECVGRRRPVVGPQGGAWEKGGRPIIHNALQLPDIRYTPVVVAPQTCATFRIDEIQEAPGCCTVGSLERIGTICCVIDAMQAPTPSHLLFPHQLRVVIRDRAITIVRITQRRAGHPIRPGRLRRDTPPAPFDRY